MRLNRFKQALQTIFYQQARELRALASAENLRKGNKVDLLHWVEPMKNAIRPYLLAEWQAGAHREAYRAGQRGVDINLHNLHKKIRAELEADLDKLVRETLKAYEDNVNAKIKELRKLLRKNKINGAEAVRAFNNHVQESVADKNRALRIVDTETANALESSKALVAQESGKKAYKRWKTDPRNPCKDCIRLNGKTVPIDKPFYVDPKGGPYAVKDNPPFHPHCLLGETPVLAPSTICAMKAHYRGACIRVSTDLGDNFSCTQNHMLLTPNGFMHAARFVKGDYIVYSGLGNRCVDGSPNNDWHPTIIKEVFDTARVSSSMTTGAVPTSAEYLHGDAAFCQGNIDIVKTDGFLWNEFDVGSSSDKHIDERSLKMRRVSLSLDCLCQSQLRNLGLRLAANGCMGSSRDFLAVFLGGVDIANRTRCAAPSRFNSRFFHDTFDMPSPNAQCFIDGKRGLSSNVHTDDFLFQRVTNVETFHFDGPVYDVSTTSSLYYIGNGVVSSNCRCHTEIVYGPLPKKRKDWVDEAIDEMLMELV